jgi:hypothetical protein
MKIGIDFDGVIAYTNLVKKRYAKRVFGIDTPAYLCDKTNFTSRFDAEKYARMTGDLYTKKHTEETPPIPGAIGAVRKLAKNHRLMLITNRSVERMSWAERWLVYYGIDRSFGSRLSSNDGVKTDICREQGCDIIIDDDIRHLNARSEDLHQILFKYRARDPGTRSECMNCFVATSWKQTLQIIQRIDEMFEMQ